MLLIRGLRSHRRICIGFVLVPIQFKEQCAMQRRVLVAGIVSMGMAFSLFGADVRLGNWKLNVAKSKFGGPAIKSQSDLREALPDGRIQHSVTREYADGKIEKYTLTYKYDGREYPVKGAAFDTVAVKRIDSQTTKFETSKKNSKAYMTGMTVVSPDARTLTQTVKAFDEKGKAVDSVFVFDRK
jgi:hypothetical protein